MTYSTHSKIKAMHCLQSVTSYGKPQSMLMASAPLQATKVQESSASRIKTDVENNGDEASLVLGEVFSEHAKAIPEDI